MSMYNQLFGYHPAAPLLMTMLKLHPKDVGRFRDCYLRRVEGTGELQIAVYTRNGGGNREEYESVTEALQKHPAYVSDADDSFDSTYATYFFKVPEEYKKEIDLIIEKAGVPPSPEEKFKTLIKNLEEGNKDSPEVKRAEEVGKQIAEHIKGGKSGIIEV